MTGGWLARAACRGLDDDTFFPVGSSGPALQQKDRAKAICRSCPVADTCYRWSVEAGELWGVWGGVDEDERRRRGTVRAFEKLDAPPEPERPESNPLDGLSNEARDALFAAGPRGRVPDGTPLSVRRELVRSALTEEFIASGHSGQQGGVRATQRGRDALSAYRRREQRTGTRVTEQLGLPIAGVS